MGTGGRRIAVWNRRAYNCAMEGKLINSVWTVASTGIAVIGSWVLAFTGILIEFRITHSPSGDECV